MRPKGVRRPFGKQDGHLASIFLDAMATEGPHERPLGGSVLVALCSGGNDLLDVGERVAPRGELGKVRGVGSGGVARGALAGVALDPAEDDREGDASCLGGGLLDDRDGATVRAVLTSSVLVPVRLAIAVTLSPSNASCWNAAARSLWVRASRFTAKQRAQRDGAADALRVSPTGSISAGFASRVRCNGRLSECSNHVRKDRNTTSQRYLG